MTDLQPGQRWTWVARAPGLRSTATHTVVPTDGGARVESSLVQEGPLGWAIARAYAGLTRRYLALETEGLRRRSLSETPDS